MVLDVFLHRRALGCFLPTIQYLTARLVLVTLLEQKTLATQVVAVVGEKFGNDSGPFTSATELSVRKPVGSAPTYELTMSR